MKFSVITLFPGLIESFLAQGLLGQAQAKGLVSVEAINPRAFTDDVHQTVDDRVFGGGDGMVMKFEPLDRALASVRATSSAAKVAVLSPQGARWTQSQARAWANEGGHRVLICGRYAGIDHRFVAHHELEEISLGDFILNGGEIAAGAIIESVARLLPGALGNKVSAVADSFGEGAGLECPQFTRPREVAGLTVPAPLLSGDHARIRAFERAVGLVRTRKLRPDLLAGNDLREACAIVEKLADNELRALGLKREDLR